MIDGLSPAQLELLSALHHDLRAYHATALPQPTDADLAEAAAVLAEGAETAAKGILYERPTAWVPAQQLVRLCRDRIDREEARQPLAPAVVAQVLRRLEDGARTAGSSVGGEGDGRGDVFFAFLGRSGAGPARSQPTGDEEGRGSPRIILA